MSNVRPLSLKFALIFSIARYNFYLIYTISSGALLCALTMLCQPTSESMRFDYISDIEIKLT